MKKLYAMLFGLAIGQGFTAFGAAKAKTVDGVLAAFRKTVDDLRSVEAAERAEAERQEILEAEAQAAKEAANYEANRAANAASRFEGLIDNI